MCWVIIWWFVKHLSILQSKYWWIRSLKCALHTNYVWSKSEWWWWCWMTTGVYCSITWSNLGQLVTLQLPPGVSSWLVSWLTRQTNDSIYMNRMPLHIQWHIWQKLAFLLYKDHLKKTVHIFNNEDIRNGMFDSITVFLHNLVYQ